MVKVGSYNILNPEYARNHPVSFLPSGGAQWASRKNLITNNITSSGCDVIALQEVSRQAFDDLKATLTGYMGYYAEHNGSADAKKPDGVAIFYKTHLQRLDVRICATNARSTTSRRDLYVDLAVPGANSLTDRIIRVACAHIEGGPNRLKGDLQLQEFKNYVEANYPGQRHEIDTYVICADFNDDGKYATSRLRFLTDYQTDGSTEESEIDKNRRIDWIYVKNNQSEAALNSIPMSRQPRASDHHMVATEMLFEDEFEPQTLLVSQPAISQPIQPDILIDAMPPDVQTAPPQPQAAPSEENCFCKFLKSFFSCLCYPFTWLYRAICSPNT
jgi:exonuclease III